MGMMDDMKNKLGNMDMDSMRAEMEELSHKEEAGQLTDAGRERLARLREHLNM